jgi:DNA-binding Xre family transcriptional regulator
MSKSKGAEADNVTALLKELRRLQAVVAQLPALQAAIVRLAESVAGPGAPAISEKKWPTYLREWRESSGKRLDDLSRMIGLSKGQLSRVENGHQPYNQRILEGYAEALGCRPGDLLTNPPVQPELGLHPLFKQLQAIRDRQNEVV